MRPKSSSPGGYGRLDRQVIVDAALELAAQPDVSDIRVRDLGERLGADPTAIYRHFRNKAQLMAALIDSLITEISRRMPVDTDWRTTLTVGATSTFDLFLEHPAIGVHLADSRPVGPAELSLVETMLRELERAGLTGSAVVRHYGALSGFVLSFTANACREVVTASRTGEATAEDLPWIEQAVEAPPESYPALARHAGEIAAMDFRSTYLSGVHILLDAIAAGASR